MKSYRNKIPEEVYNIYLNLTLEQIIELKHYMKTKLIQISVKKSQIKNKISKFNDLYSDSEIIKNIFETIKEFKIELKYYNEEYIALNKYSILLNDIHLIEEINNFPFVETKINKLNFLKNNLLNFDEISVNRFSLTIREFIDTHLCESFKHLFTPKITGILGRIFPKYIYDENYDFRFITVKNNNSFCVRSNDLKMLKIINQQILNMITFFKLKIYSIIANKSYVEIQYYRIFLLKKCNIPTDIIKLIFDFLGPIHLEQSPSLKDKEKFSNETHNINYIQKLLERL